MHESNGHRALSQRRLDQHFASRAQQWKDVYEKAGPRGLLVRGRFERAVSYTRELQLNPGSRALDVGCGAGLMTTELASRGVLVDAVDTVPQMLDLTQQRATLLGLQDSVSVTSSDVVSLPFASQTFDLVVALGLISWLDSPLPALGELARVCRPDGHIVLSCRNRVRADLLLDPRHTPLLDPVKHRIRRAQLGRSSSTSGSPSRKSYTPRKFDSMLASVGFMKVMACTYGFGAPKFFGKRLLPERLSTSIHHRLQELADARVPLVENLGFSYIVLAQKDCDPAMMNTP